jgi:multicomponent Na+:H+ antiporter subunit G
MIDMVFNILLIIGLIFNLFGCIGLLRLPDLYNRLQAATKCVTLGTCCILLSLVAKFGLNDFGIKGLLAIPFLFFTSTVAAHALIRGSYKFGIRLWDKSIVDEYKSELPDGTEEKEDI